eukprot:jgi/Psemu1/300310/fgenesh1_kg.9_\
MTTKNNLSGASFVVLLALLVIVSTPVGAFAPQNVCRRKSDRARSPSSLGMSDSSKDDEIAKLEEQLRKLKEEKGEVVPTEATTTATTTTTAPVDADEEIPLEEASMDMFLSEGWKEARSNYDPSNTATRKRQEEEQGNVVGTIAKVAGGLLAVILFSQIPVGQEDLSKYSAIKSGPPTTTIDLGDINSVKGQTSSDL